MKIISRIEPQPPIGIKYMLGDETWLLSEDRSPPRLHCEEWGNLGPLELDRTIEPNAAGFGCRSTDFFPPVGAIGFTKIDGVYFWTDTDCFGRTADQRAAEGSADLPPAVSSKD